MVMYSEIKLVFPDKPFALIFDHSLVFETTLIEIAVDTIDRKTTLRYLHIQTRLMLGPAFYFSKVFRDRLFIRNCKFGGGGALHYNVKSLPFAG